MEQLLKLMQREAAAAANSPARADSTIGFEQMREIAELARKLAYQNFVEHLNALVIVDKLKESPVRAAACIKVREALKNYEKASEAVTSFERAHSSFVGFTAEMATDNFQAAQDLALQSKAHVDSAAGSLQHVADYTPKGGASDLSGIGRNDIALPSSRVSKPLWGQILQVAVVVAKDLGARIAALPARIVEQAKSMPMARATVKLTSNFLERLTAVRRDVEANVDRANVVLHQAASAMLNSLGQAVDSSGVRLKARMEARLGEPGAAAKTEEPAPDESTANRTSIPRERGA